MRAVLTLEWHLDSSTEQNRQSLQAAGMKISNDFPSTSCPTNHPAKEAMLEGGLEPLFPPQEP